MSRFNAKMNELAESIKGKNPDVSGKLSITGMIDAVNGITISDGSSVDLSGVTATANDVLASVKFMDKTGTLKSGVIQTVTLEKSGNTVSVKKGYVAADSSVTVESGGEGGSTGGVELYRCVSYDNGGVIPAHDDLNISGSTSAVNGTYKRGDTVSRDKYVRWVKDTIEVYYNTLDKCWVVNDATANPVGSKDGALYYADAPYLSASDGTPVDPYTWAAVQSDTPRITKVLTNDMCCKYNLRNSTEYNCLYIQLYMEAGVEYQIGRKYPENYWQGVDLYLFDCAKPYGGYINDISGSSAFTVGDIEFSRVMKYKVETTGMYLLCVQANSSGYAMTDVTLGFDHNMDIPTAQAQSPADVTAWTAVTGSGNITVSKVAVAERPATGVRVWSGTKATQAADFTWSYTDTITAGMTVIGLEPVVGKTYSADTTIEVAQTYSIKPPTVDSTDLMVCLAHFDGDRNTFVDATDTCIVSFYNQAGLTKDSAKFGAGCWEGNYLNPPEGGVNVSMLPLMDAFTVEWWEWYRGNVAFGGAVMAVMDYDSWEWKFLNGVNLLPGHPLCKKQEWFHHAFVREKGSSVVTEYISGIPVATHTWEGLLGGSDTVWFGAGGVYGQNHNNRGDELAVFSYARYHGAFTPNNAPYPNINSGLNVDTEEREVSVSGLTGIHLANKRSYALFNQETEGTDRMWITADGKWRICYDNNMEGEWVIADRQPDMDGNYTVIARLPVEYDEDYNPIEQEPIGNPNWKDAITGAKVNVIRLRDPIPNDHKWAWPTKFYLTGCAVEGINGEYIYNPNLISLPGDGFWVWDLAGWDGPGDYIIHPLRDQKTMEFYVFFIVHRDNPMVHLYQCSIWDMVTPGHKWGCMAGVEPAPVISLTKPLI